MLIGCRGPRPRSALSAVTAPISLASVSGASRRTRVAVCACFPPSALPRLRLQLLWFRIFAGNDNCSGRLPRTCSLGSPTAEGRTGSGDAWWCSVAGGGHSLDDSSSAFHLFNSRLRGTEPRRAQALAHACSSHHREEQGSQSRPRRMGAEAEAYTRLGSRERPAPSLPDRTRQFPASLFCLLQSKASGLKDRRPPPSKQT